MTKYQALSELLLVSSRVSGISKNSRVYKSLKGLLATGRASTGCYEGSGRHIHAVKWTEDVSDILTKMGIAHRCGNNAPRGGVSGEYVEVTMPAFMREIKRKVAEENARIEEERAGLRREGKANKM